MGGNSSSRQMQGMMAESRKMSEKAAKALEGVDLPDTTKMELSLKYPELILSSPQELLGETAQSLIQEDPDLREVQKLAIEGQMERAKTGFTAEEKAKVDELRRMAGSEDQARQSSIISSLAERGALGGGQELAARLSSSQAATDRQAQGGLQLGAELARAKREALGQAAQSASSMSQQDYQKALNKAQGQDQIRQFNAQVSSRDTAARQAQEAQKTALSNQQQQYNTQLGQQQFQNEMAKQGAIAGAYTGQANLMNQQAAMLPQKGSMLGGVLSGAGSGAATGASIGGGAGAGWGAGIGAAAGLLGGLKDGGIKYNMGGIAPQMNPSISGDMNEPKPESGLTGEQYQSILGGLSGLLGDKQEQQPMPEFNPVNIQSLTDPAKNIMPQLQFNQGGYRKMGYEEGGSQTEGRIVPEENYAGDELPDRINSGEMVLNVEQQERLNQMLQELKRLKSQKRVDDRLEQGELQVNPNQQDSLMALARGEQDLSSLPEDNIIKSEEPSSMQHLMQLLKRK